MAAKPTIQRGTFTSGASTATSFSIVRGTASGFDTTVDPAKTILLASYRTSAAGLFASPHRIRLVDGDTIECARGNTTSSALTVEWMLVSFASGVTVQHIAATIPGDSETISVPVSISASSGGGRFLIPCGGFAESNPSIVDVAARWFISAGAEITVARNSARSIVGQFACQVVDWDDATVQTVSVSDETWAATTLDKTISAVDLAKTMVFGNGHTSNAQADTQVVASIHDATTLRLSRAGSTSRVYNATYYVVSVGSGVAVQHRSVVLDAVTSNTASIDAVTAADTVVHLGSMWNGSSVGASSETTTTRIRGTAVLTDSTTVTVTRHATDGVVTFAAQVIEFSEAAPPAPSGERIVISQSGAGRPFSLTQDPSNGKRMEITQG